MLTEWQKRVIILVCLLSRFLAASVYSLQAPFFPQEAEQKHVPPSEYGLVFSIYEIVVLLTAPIIGANISRIGTKLGICAGLFFAGFACILFGSISLVPDTRMFVGMAIMIRIFEGLGQATSAVCTFTLIATTFQDTFGVILGYTGTAFSSGMMAGPAIGGLLFAAGGFWLPFVATGGFLLACMLIGIKCFPPSGTPPCRTPGLSRRLLRLKGVYLAIFSAFSCTVSLGILAATLEPHIRQFNYSPKWNSLFFLITPMVYAVTNPITGKLLDRRYEPKKFILAGASLKILAFSLIGPFPWIPIKPTTYLVVIGLVMNGLANSCQILPSFTQMQKCSREDGIPFDVNTSAVISSVFQLSISLGLSFGPIIGGGMLQVADFRKGLLIAIVINIITIIWAAVCLHSNNSVPLPRGQDFSLEFERQPLLQGSSIAVPIQEPSEQYLPQEPSEQSSTQGHSRPVSLSPQGRRLLHAS